MKAAEILEVRDDEGTQVRMVSGSFWVAKGPVEGIPRGRSMMARDTYFAVALGCRIVPSLRDLANFVLYLNTNIKMRIKNGSE